MQNFDTPSVTPAAETPSKRKKAFSMMEAKPASREVPAKETASARRQSLRVVKDTEAAEEAQHIKSLRKSVAELRPLSNLEKQRAKVKLLKGRIASKLGRHIEGKNSEEIRANLSFGDKFKAGLGSWLDKITNKKSDSDLNDLLNQLKLAENTLEIMQAAPDISITESVAPQNKPKTIRDIKTRIAELEAKQAAEADRALEKLHVEVEPVAPAKRDIAARIEAAKAKGKKNQTLGAEDIIPETKTSPLAESVRVPKAEETTEIPVDFEDNQEPVLDKTSGQNFESDVKELLHLAPESFLYKFRNTPAIKDRLSKLMQDIKSNEAEVNALELSIESLRGKKQEEKALNLEEQLEKLGDDWQATYNKEMDELEAMARQESVLSIININDNDAEVQTKKETSPTTVNKETVVSDSMASLQNKILELSKSNPIYKDLLHQASDPEIRKYLFELHGLDVKKKLSLEGAELEAWAEEYAKKLQTIAERAHAIAETVRQTERPQDKAQHKEGEVTEGTFDLPKARQIKHEAKVQVSSELLKETQEEKEAPVLKDSELIEDTISRKAPPPPSAKERKRRIDLQAAMTGQREAGDNETIENDPYTEALIKETHDAYKPPAKETLEMALDDSDIIDESISRKAPPPPSAKERRKKDLKEEVKFDDSLAEQEKKLNEADFEFGKQNEEIIKAGWLGQILREYPLVDKHKENPAMAKILNDLKHDLSVFDARREGITDKSSKGSRKRKILELKAIAAERTEKVNHAIDQLESLAQKLEGGAQLETEKPLISDAYEKYDLLKEDLEGRINLLMSADLKDVKPTKESFIEDYINLTKERDGFYAALSKLEDDKKFSKSAKNAERQIKHLQNEIDAKNAILRQVGAIGVNEDPSITTSGRSGIGNLGIIGDNSASKRIQRGKYEVTPSGVREKTRSTLERTTRQETKELQPFNTAWAIEKMGKGAANRWDLVTPLILKKKLGEDMSFEISLMIGKLNDLPASEKDAISQEYIDLPKMMDIVRGTERFNQCPEAAAYIFLRALSPETPADFSVQGIVEETLSKLDRMLSEAAKELDLKRQEEEKGFSVMRAKPAPRGTETKKTESVRKDKSNEAPQTKKARSVRASGKSAA